MNIHRNIYVEEVDSLSIEAHPVELVERKGIGSFTQRLTLGELSVC